MLSLAIDGLIKAAPAIVRLIGGNKAGNAADKVMNIAEKITGKSGTTAVDAIKADPALAMQFEKAVMQQETDILRLQVEDFRNARERDVELRKMGDKNLRADILAIGSFGGLMACIMLLIFVDIPPTVKEVLMLLFGALVVIVKDVFGFEFGSSRGSKDKDKMAHL